jgi:hypothetical protein
MTALPGLTELKFVVRAYDNLVDVQWLVPFGRRGGATYRVLTDALEDLPGVEKVTLRRYSLTLDVATHVIGVNQVAEAVAEVLRGQVAEDFAFHYPGIPVEVTVHKHRQLRWVQA